jgi:MtN3 and saliva related transmembrane protein
MIELIGYIGAILTTASFLPQAIQTIKTRDTSGISFWMYSMFVTGVVFWLIYGVLLGNKTIIFANIVTLILASSVLVIKIQNCRKR